MADEKFNHYRKLWHLLGLVIPLALFYDIFSGALGLKHATRAIIFSGLAFVNVVFILIETFRLQIPAFNDFFWKYFGFLMKEKERNRITATLPYFLSNAFVVAIYPPEIAFLSMFFLLVGDPFAAFFGFRYGKYRFKNGKSLVGVLAFFTVSLVGGFCALALFSITNASPEFRLFLNNSINFPAVLILFFGATTAAAAEFYSSNAWKGFLDDNLTIPVISSATMAIVTLACIRDSSTTKILFPLNELFH